MEERTYGQRYAPDILVYFQGHSYNLIDYYQDFISIHKTNKKSKYIIKVAVLPENLKESLFEKNVDITIKETHRTMEGKDIEYNYELYKPKIKIIEHQNCQESDNPVSYKIIITGRILEKKEIII